MKDGVNPDVLDISRHTSCSITILGCLTIFIMDISLLIYGIMFLVRKANGKRWKELQQAFSTTNCIIILA